MLGQPGFRSTIHCDLLALTPGFGSDRIFQQIFPLIFTNVVAKAGAARKRLPERAAFALQHVTMFNKTFVRLLDVSL
jgi:hypothetical protein